MGELGDPAGAAVLPLSASCQVSHGAGFAPAFVVPPISDAVFHIDTPAIPTTPQGASDDDTTDVRTPVASTCPDDPFTTEGRAAPVG